MVDYEISELPEIDYSKEPRYQTRYIGTNIGIRRIDPRDRIDMQRLQAIDRDEEVAAFMPGEVKSDVSLREYTKHGVDEKGMIFGISAGSSHSDRNEIGELQGWCQFYPDEHTDELIEKGFIPSSALNKTVVEISFSKVPKAQPGQMKNGVRGAILSFLTERSREEGDDKQSDNLLDSMPIITGYVDAGNPASANILSSIGFEKKGELLYSPEVTEQDSLYVLNWENFFTLVNQAMLNEVKTMNAQDQITSLWKFLDHNSLQAE